MAELKKIIVDGVEHTLPVVTPDEALDANSTNPVQNKAVYSALTELEFGFAEVIGQKQDALVSGTNIKTINGNSILGSGNITIEGGSGGSGGVSSVFEDVDALPDSPDGQKIYRVAVYQYNYYVYFEGSLLNLTELLAQNGGTINIIQVSELPENPEIFLDEASMTITMYVMGEDLHGYATIADSGAWVSNDGLFYLMGGGEFGTAYGGIITSLDTPNLTDGYAYIYSTPTYSYVNANANSQFEFASSDELSELENNLGVGREGTGTRSEVFNNYDENVASGDYSHAEGWRTTAYGDYSHAEGQQTTASGDYSHAEGYGFTNGNAYTFTRTDTRRQYTCTSSFSPGTVFTDTNGICAAVTVVSGKKSPYIHTFDKDFTTTEGETVDLRQVVGVASGDYSHAEGYNTTAAGIYSHAEGYHTTASKESSHAEGYYTKASGQNSHAEGSYTTASNMFSHAEGQHTTASGQSSHAEGTETIASGSCSHAEGSNTVASGSCSHAQGKYNIIDTENKYAHIVGNGSHSAHSNAHTLDWDGNAWFKGNVRVGGTSWDDATPVGSGGGGSVFEDVTELPENPDSSKIYRVKDYKINMGGLLISSGDLTIQNESVLELKFYYVNELPSLSIAKPIIDSTYMNFYILENDVYCLYDGNWIKNEQIALALLQEEIDISVNKQYKYYLNGNIINEPEYRLIKTYSTTIDMTTNSIAISLVGNIVPKMETPKKIVMKFGAISSELGESEITSILEGNPNSIGKTTLSSGGNNAHYANGYLMTSPGHYSINSQQPYCDYRVIFTEAAYGLNRPILTQITITPSYIFTSNSQVEIPVDIEIYSK